MRATLALFGAPAFRMAWGSSLAAAGAQRMERVLSAWLALGVGGASVAVGASLPVRPLQLVLCGQGARTIADRLRRRSILMAVAAVATFLCLALAFLFSTGRAELWHLLAIGLLFGLVQVF